MAASPILKATNDEGRRQLAQAKFLLDELMSGDTQNPYQVLNRTLPRFVDDAERDMGSDVYTRMRKDPAVASALDTLKMRTVENGMGLVPAIAKSSAANPNPDQDKESEIAKVYQDEIQMGLDNLDEFPLEDLVYDQLNALAYGHSLSEIVLKLVNGNYTYDVIRTKPRQNYNLVSDVHLKLLGVIGIEPGHGISMPQGILMDLKSIPNFQPMWAKFCILSFARENASPLGTSLFRPAYHAWWMKQQVWPQYLKFLMQFASPSLIGYTPEDAAGGSVKDPTLTAEDVMKGLLLAFMNGSIIALRGGSKVDLIQSTGEGRAFDASIELFDRQITQAILKQTRATKESENGSRADSESATDLLDVLILWIRGIVSRMFRSQVFIPLLTLNHGEEIARRYAPRLQMSEAVQADVAAELTAFSGAIQNGAVFPSQLGYYAERIGAPIPTASEVAIFTKKFELGSEPEPKVVPGDSKPADKNAA